MNKQERDIKKIDPVYLLGLLRGEESDQFKIIEDKIYSSDPEDGGAEHTVIIQDIVTGKYYTCDYCDWDIDYNQDDFGVDELSEVFPKQILKIVYE